MPEIPVNGTTIHYEESGPRDAPALLLGHSLFFDHAMFDPLADRLDDTFRVVRYCHRGQGHSARDEPYDMDTLTDDAAALIEALDLGPCHYAGNSMGGFVALRLAARRPDLVRTVAAIGSSGGAEGKIAEFDPLVEAMGASGVAPMLDIVMHIMFGDTSLSDRPELTGPWSERLAALGPEIAGPAHAVVHRTSVLEELRDAQVPVLAIAGAEDHAYSVDDSRAIAEACPDGRLEIVQAAGHSVSLEQPDEVAALLRAHIGAAVAEGV
ncbi:alpha/beta fold hydrolase [Paraconexibacter sp.]|uniref:alpha/beta fold hydrolase n=1 Tax=Paraconexibacter sp. TaxID=2949640 RepID=UPI0035628341